MDIAVRIATPADRDAVGRMVEAMDRHYESPAPASGALAPTVERWLSGEGTDAHIALAFDGEDVLGIAIFAVLHPGVALTGLLYLKDLFVTDEARGHGVGDTLMRFLAGYCAEKSIGRIDLTTERDNDGARRFYERLGGDLLEWKVSYRFGPEALLALSDNAGQPPNPTASSRRSA